MNRFEKFGFTPKRPIPAYIVPEGATSFDDWCKDPAADEFMHEGFRILRERFAVPRRRGTSPDNVPQGPLARSEGWDGTKVLRLFRNPILKGMPGRVPYLEPAMRFVSATKGLEQGTLLRMSEVARQVIGDKFEPHVAVLSGPTFAREVASGDPTAVVIAAADRELALSIQREFSGPTFRLYANDDPVGVELGAALKNIIAIGAGICDGLGLGSNAIAALITRGLAEITRLAIALGGRPQTLSGLAGLGDLVLTCNGALSRNRSVGMELAKGRKLADIVSSMTMIAEGVETTAAACDLARRSGVDMPITEQMDAILRGRTSPRDAIRELMERELKAE